jgi:HAE1 family hydrophobic/amphiphilic exporter-1
MNMSELSVRRPVTILMMIFIVIIIGFVSLSKLPIDLYPNFEIPVAIVNTGYEGVGPQEVEALITKPVEDVLGTVENIKNVSSITSEGRSIVIAEFEFGTDMEFASLNMREKIDMITSFLPDAATKPMVLKIDPNALPIMELSVIGGNLEKTQLFAEDVLKSRLERIEGVASVDVSGGYEKEVRIQLGEAELVAYGLDLNTISQVLRAENINLPGGSVDQGSRTLTIRTVGEFTSIEDIRNLPVPLQSGQKVMLKDIANVSFEYKSLGSIYKTDGERSISLSIQKQSGVNTVQVARRIKAAYAKFQADYPEYTFNVSSDQSIFIEKSIANVTSSAVVGGLLAILVLFIFLRNLRTTFVIAVSIPISIIATFILIYYQGITLNLMTLGGLALGIGMLVDNSIVVLENIYRLRQEGYNKKDAAILGAKEVGMAVTASTLTTLAVFLPITFVEGITSTIFRELALTVSFSLSASLIVSLTLVPMMASQMLHIDSEMGAVHHGKFKVLNWIYDRFDVVFKGIETYYGKILSKSLRHGKITIFIALGIFVASLISIPFVGAEFFPSLDQGSFTIDISLPTGSELKDTEDIVAQVEKHLTTYPEIETVFSSVGQGNNQFVNRIGSNGAKITVNLVPGADRIRSTKEITDLVRGFTKTLPGAEIKLSAAEAGFGGMGGSAIQITVKGFDLEELRVIGNDISKLVQTVEGTREVESSFGDGIEEVAVKINREMAKNYGLSTAQIASAIQTAIAGQAASQLRLGDTEVDITVIGDAQYKASVEQLNQLKLKTPMGLFIPLGAVATIQTEISPIAINRDDQSRTVTISSQIFNRDLQSVTKDVEAKLDGYELPDDYILNFGGQNEEMVKAFKDLMIALILAVVIVYMVLAAQFESLIHPFTIILSVPLSFSGAIFGLLITGRTLSVPSFIGLIMLAGIVVNNAIVLVDYINTRRGRGETIEAAILAAGPIRLRPILMTTLTTVLGLIPLALGIGDGAEAQAPLATAVIFGLSLSTLLTLVFIPVVYRAFDDISVKLKRKFKVGGTYVEETN